MRELTLTSIYLYTQSKFYQFEFFPHDSILFVRIFRGASAWLPPLVYKMSKTAVSLIFLLVYNFFKFVDRSVLNWNKDAMRDKTRPINSGLSAETDSHFFNLVFLKDEREV